ncbi:MAG: hypothetical protein IPL83_00805 [Bdellovibrionales bacterium]|nr:hypothetical protein [Bdellovibrionales bacterium]
MKYYIDSMPTGQHQLLQLLTKMVSVFYAKSSNIGTKSSSRDQSDSWRAPYDIWKSPQFRSGLFLQLKDKVDKFINL